MTLITIVAIFTHMENCCTPNIFIKSFTYNLCIKCGKLCVYYLRLKEFVEFNFWIMKHDVQLIIKTNNM